VDGDNLAETVDGVGGGRLVELFGVGDVLQKRRKEKRAQFGGSR